MTNNIELSKIISTVDAVLQPSNFSDYGPNGLQVQGKAQISKIVTGVTASLALIEQAVQQQADAILVHHGLFWRQPVPVVGWMKKRLALLLKHDINLLAYHLPLDAHIELGNNAQLAKLMGWRISEQFGEQNLIFKGSLAKPLSAQQLALELTKKLDRQVTLIAGSQKPIMQLAWCSGGGQGFFEQAIARGVDAYITGEISEPQAHYAREMGVTFIAAGHHATEKYGIMALGQYLQQQFNVAHQFIDIDNPA